MLLPDPVKLRAARMRRRLRKETVAVDIGSTFPSLTAYESGTASPSARVLLALAACYGVPVESLCSDTDVPVGAR